MKTVYIDYDGTLAYFLKDKSLEEVAQKGYTLTVPMMEGFCNALKMLMDDKELAEYDFKVLSAVLNDYSVQDKRTMLTRVFGSEFAEKAIFVEYGQSKALFAEGRNILIDDFSFNLHEWERCGGIGLKVYNGINGNHGTWKGYSVHSTANQYIIYRTLKGILKTLGENAA